MSDIQQLKKIITSLEVQGNDLSGYVGLLSEVQAARAGLSASETVIGQAISSLLDHLHENGVELERFKDKMIAMEKGLKLAEKTSAETLATIHNLSFVTPEQLVTEVKVVNKVIKDSTAKLSSKIETIDSSIKDSTVKLNSTIESLDNAVTDSVTELNSKIESIGNAVNTNRKSIWVFGLINLVALLAVLATQLGIIG